MVATVELSVPRTAVVSEGAPYTIYEIVVRLPLHSLTVKKRYSEFVNLQSLLASQAGSQPPAKLPPKHYFSRTTNSKSLTESRRAGLEAFLRSINGDSDSRWRDTPAWRAFLNLPSNSSSRGGRTSTAARNAIPLPSDNAASDPAAWLDLHRDLKALLHEARLHVTARDQADSVGSGREAAGEANRVLVRVAKLIATEAERSCRGGAKREGGPGKTACQHSQEKGGRRLGRGEGRTARKSHERCPERRPSLEEGPGAGQGDCVDTGSE